MRIAENIKEIQARIDAACQKSRRDPKSVTLIGVAKGQPVEKILEATAAGLTDIGENYAQDLIDHWSQIKSRLNWHFIGHLQRNKVKQMLDKVTLIHSVDSLSLAQEIDKRAKALNKTQAVLIEINMGGEATKTGIPVETIHSAAAAGAAASAKEAESLFSEINHLHHVCLKGFMVIPPPCSDPEKMRPYFQRLREIRDAINQKNLYKTTLTELSMGMSGDFEIAIEEGATLVRIGTAIFGARD